MVEVKDIANMVSGALTDIVNAEVEKTKVNIGRDFVVDFLRQCNDEDFYNIVKDAGKEDITNGELNAEKVEIYLENHHYEVKDILDSLVSLDKDDIPESVHDDIQSEAIDEWFEGASGHDIYDRMSSSEYRELIDDILDANL